MSAPLRRFGWRVWFLPVFLWPLGLDLLIEVFRSHPRGLVGAALGLGLAVLAARRLASGRHGSKRAGAVLMGVSAGLTALLAAKLNPAAALVMAGGAWLGTRLLTDDLPEAAPPPAPVPRPAGDPLAAIRAQVAQARLAAPALPEAARIAGAAQALDAVLADLDRRPARIAEARRPLAMQAEGLARIVERLEAGAKPPQSLPMLLDDMRAATERLRDDLSAAESEALDIQVKVLAERLRQEGP